MQKPYQQRCSKTQHLTAFSDRAPADVEVACTQRKGASSCVFLEQNSCLDSSLGTSWMLESGSKVLVSRRSHCWVHPHDHRARYLDSSPWCENKALPRKVTTGGWHAEQVIPSWTQQMALWNKRESLSTCYITFASGRLQAIQQGTEEDQVLQAKNSAYSKDGQNQWRRRLHLLHHENCVKCMYSIYCLNLINT